MFISLRQNISKSLENVVMRESRSKLSHNVTLINLKKPIDSTDF